MLIKICEHANERASKVINARSKVCEVIFFVYFYQTMRVSFYYNREAVILFSETKTHFRALLTHANL